MPTIRVEKQQLLDSKQEKLDLTRSIKEYRHTLAIKNNKIANLVDKTIDLEIKIDELMQSLSTYQQATRFYKDKISDIPRWVKKIYGI